MQTGVPEVAGQRQQVSSRCAVVRVLEVGITGLTVLGGRGLGPAEEEENGSGGVDKDLPVILRNKLPSSPLSNERPEGESWVEMVTRPRKEETQSYS